MASNHSIDPMFLSNLMNRLHLRHPLFDTNALLSSSLDDAFSDLGSDADDDDELPVDAKERSLLAEEEAKLEKEIIRIIHSGNPVEALKPNSGQSVSIGEHSICVGFHEESGSEYRVWEWHGHLIIFDEEEGYSPEYIYGSYFERLVDEKRKKNNVNGSPGLRDLIGDGAHGVGSGRSAGVRVLHRSSLNTGSAAK
ncbi:hypothetical protein IHE45_07G122100 [Dioscorea alata]|uniref:Uncharacterized protein n=1 Tax=Dioscorea alata TaxID=55571 RepID=A0ACB7VU92_DIOAL|nr:hypothetical protein IHE45_07G122100 [Dioscorea alata]